MQRTTPKFLWVSEEGEKQLTYEHKEKTTGMVFIILSIYNHIYRYTSNKPENELVN